MDYKEMKERIKRGVEECQERIIALGHDLWKTPETGFREVKTMERLLKEIRDMGLGKHITTWEGVTGFNVEIDTGKPGPTLMLIGELDSVICFDHPDCNPKTGAVHACGHHAQTTAMIGAAYALIKSGVLNELCGKIILQGVPAEECLQLEWRLNEIREGRLHYMGGKAELLYRGAYDGVDLAVSVHPSDNPMGCIWISGGSNGFIAKTVTVKGKAAHAAASPEDGVNALYAANLALMAFNAMRETFRDEDRIRVHPIMTRGGDIVNAIPDTATVETLIRGRTMEAVIDAARKYDRAFAGACYAMGAKAHISTQPGFLPAIDYTELADVLEEVGYDIVSDSTQVVRMPANTGSTDFGDLQSLFPAAQIFYGLCCGEAHGNNFRPLSDEVYLFPSIYMACFAAKVLGDNGKIAKKIHDNYKPIYQRKEEYFDLIDSLFQEADLP